VFGTLAGHSGRDTALRHPAIRQKTFVPLPSGKLTLAAKLTSKSNRSQTESGQKNKSPLSSVPSLPKAIEGYPSLLKPIFKNLFLAGENLCPPPLTANFSLV
jgi:hypothetical protein